MRISTNWLRDFVTLAPPLERIAERLTMVGLEVKRIEPRPDIKDTIFEIEVTTNRPDWLSHFGVAREIHAVENTGLKIPPSKNPEHRPMPSGWKLDLKEADGCPYYTACLIEGIQEGPTPDWMKNRLEASGLRSINLLVDITNYVLLEIGQPLHAFDADLLRGHEVQIRRAKAGENFAAINGVTHALGSEDLVIADRERTVALAGIMGGSETEVSSKTRNIFLESAFFHPRWVRRSSLRRGLSSESSYRFERRVDPEGVDLGLERAIYLFRELAHPRNVSAVTRAGRKPIMEKSHIHLSLEQVGKILGMEVKPHQIHSILTRLALDVKSDSPETWVVGVPSYRPDLQRPVDLVEEVARLGGYDKIQETLPERPPIEIPTNPLRNLEEKTRDFFAGVGLFETVSFSLTNPSHFETAGFDPKAFLEIHNPIHQELTLLRPSFLISLIEVLSRNERFGQQSVSIFEVANLYFQGAKDSSPAEERWVGILLAGERTAGWNDSRRAMDFYDLKGVIEDYLEYLDVGPPVFVSLEAPCFEGAAQIKIGSETVGQIGRVSKTLRKAWDLSSKPIFAEINLERLVPLLPKKRRFKDIARYPSVARDLSIIVDEKIQVAEILSFITQLGKDWVREVTLIDLFRGGRVPKGCQNLTFRITYQSTEQTLLSEEVQQLHNEIASQVSRKFAAVFQERKE